MCVSRKHIVLKDNPLWCHKAHRTSLRLVTPGPTATHWLRLPREPCLSRHPKMYIAQQSISVFVGTSQTPTKTVSALFWEIIITQGVSSSSNSSPYSLWTAHLLSLCLHHLLSLSWKALLVFGRSIKKCRVTDQKHPTSKMLKKKDTEGVWLK